MTYWVYAVNRTIHQNSRAVAVADIRITYTDREGNIKGFSENDTVDKMLIFDTPKNWRAIILVKGDPFWEESNRKQILTNLSKNEQLSSAKSLKDHLIEKHNDGFITLIGDGILGIIFVNLNTKEISTCNVIVDVNSDNIKISLTDPISTTPGRFGFCFDYQESRIDPKKFIWKDKDLSESTLGFMDDNFAEKAISALEGVIKQYASPISNRDSSSIGGEMKHFNTVSSSVDTVIMYSDGRIVHKKATRQARGEEDFFPDEFNRPSVLSSLQLFPLEPLLQPELNNDTVELTSTHSPKCCCRCSIQ